MHRLESHSSPAAGSTEPAWSSVDPEAWVDEDRDSAAPLVRLCGAAALAILALATASIVLV